MLKRKHVSPRLQWLIVKQNQTMRLRHTVEEPRLCQWCPLMALLKLVSVKNDYIGFVPYWWKTFRKAWIPEVSSPALCATTLQCVAFLLTTWRVPKIYSNLPWSNETTLPREPLPPPANFYRARTADSSIPHKERYGGSLFLQKVERLCFHLHLGRSGGWRLDILLRIQTPP